VRINVLSSTDEVVRNQSFDEVTRGRRPARSRVRSLSASCVGVNSHNPRIEQGYADVDTAQTDSRKCRSTEREERRRCDLLVAFVSVTFEEVLSRVHDAVEGTRADYFEPLHTPVKSV